MALNRINSAFAPSIMEGLQMVSSGDKKCRRIHDLKKMIIKRDLRASEKQKEGYNCSKFKLIVCVHWGAIDDNWEFLKMDDNDG